MSGIVSHNLMNLKAKQLENYIKEEEKNSLKIQRILDSDTVKAKNKKQLDKNNLPSPADIDWP